MAIRYGNLGLIEKLRGKLDDAEAYYKKALAIDEKLGIQEGVATQYGNIGLIEEARGNMTEARRLWMLASDLFRKIGMKPQEQLVQGWLDRLKE